MFSTLIGRLRLAGFAEAASWLLLLGAAMPLKYFAGMPQAVKVVGWLHGILFIIYILTLFIAYRKFRWPFKKFFLGGVAAFLPFGTLAFDKELRKDEIKGSKI